MEVGIDKVDDVLKPKKKRGAKSFIEYRQKLVRKKEMEREAKNKAPDIDLSIIGNQNRRTLSKQRISKHPTFIKPKSSQNVPTYLRKLPLIKKKSGATPKVGFTRRPPMRRQFTQQDDRFVQQKLSMYEREEEIKKQREYQKELYDKEKEIELNSRIKKEN